MPLEIITDVQETLENELSSHNKMASEGGTDALSQTI